jgi:thiopeptide-type bacteriocin biosynthesis protein
MQINVALRAREGGAQAVDDAMHRVVDAVIPLARSLQKRGRLACFYFMRKNPGLRLRFDLQGPRAEATRAIESLLDGVAREDRAVGTWFPSVYEPETYKFGGPPAMAAIHAYFFADSSAWWRWEALRRAGGTRIDPRLLSASVLDHLFGEFVDGPEEVWDVWCRIAAIHGAPIAPVTPVASERPRPAPPPLESLAERVSPGERALLRAYAVGNRALARRFRALYASGKLLFANRLVLPHVATYHWNRYGFSPENRASIFTPMMRAYSPYGASLRTADEGS